MSGDTRLGERSRRLLSSSNTDLVVSLLTLFEIELKQRAGKLAIQGYIGEFLDNFGIEVYRPYAHELTKMMKIDIDHSDPFDCALIGLAQIKQWTVMTSDQILLKLAGGLVPLVDSTK